MEETTRPLVYKYSYRVSPSEIDGHERLIDALVQEVDALDDKTIRLYVMTLTRHRELDGDVDALFVELWEMCSSNDAHKRLQELPSRQSLFKALHSQEFDKGSATRSDLGGYSAVGYDLLGASPPLPIVPWRDDPIDSKDTPF